MCRGNIYSQMGVDCPDPEISRDLVRLLDLTIISRHLASGEINNRHGKRLETQQNNGTHKSSGEFGVILRTQKFRKTSQIVLETLLKVVASRPDANFILSSLAAPEVVVTTISVAAIDDKVGIMTILIFHWRYLSWSQCSQIFWMTLMCWIIA